MSEEIAETPEADISMVDLFASLPRWSRIAIGVVFTAECALIAAGLTRTPPDEAGFIRFELPSANPAPGFSTL